MSTDRTTKKEFLGTFPLSALEGMFGGPVATHTGKNNGKPYQLYMLETGDLTEFNVLAYGLANGHVAGTEDLFSFAGEYHCFQDEDPRDLDRYFDVSKLSTGNPVYISGIAVQKTDLDQSLSSVMLRLLTEELTKISGEMPLVHVVRFSDDSNKYLRSKFSRLGYRDVLESGVTIRPEYASLHHGLMFRRYG